MTDKENIKKALEILKENPELMPRVNYAKCEIRILELIEGRMLDD